LSFLGNFYRPSIFDPVQLLFKHPTLQTTTTVRPLWTIVSSAAQLVLKKEYNKPTRIPKKPKPSRPSTQVLRHSKTSTKRYGYSQLISLLALSFFLLCFFCSRATHLARHGFPTCPGVFVGIKVSSIASYKGFQHASHHANPLLTGMDTTSTPRLLACPNVAMLSLRVYLQTHCLTEHSPLGNIPEHHVSQPPGRIRNPRDSR
jgi:hypothetical protein